MNSYTFTPIQYSHPLPQADRHYVLYDQPDRTRLGTTGTGIIRNVLSAGLHPAKCSWDLLSVALSIVAADQTTTRGCSPDGWTRHFKIVIAVYEPDTWDRIKPVLTRMLRFLTNDIWNVEFIANDNDSPLPRKKIYPSNDVVVLLSGGLDSLIGTIDLKSRDFEPYAVSQIVRGEQQAQSIFAQQLGGLAHVQFSHSPRFDKEKENSSRARSLLFLAFGTLIATSLERYKDNNQVILYVCENGFISLNPPLTPARLGSLSTRTTHPTFIADFQLLLEKLNLNVKLENPYQLATKGEMLQQCLDQPLISRLAHQSVSCGKYRKHNYMHCGRCLPCLIRRAAFRAWGIRDRTQYKYANLSLEDANHANYDDVRSAAMAISLAKAKGVSGFIDSSLLLQDAVILKSYERLISRGLKELEQLLLSFKKKW